MATNKSLMGLFQNNRRREAHSVTCTLPAVISSADLREGTPVETLEAVTYDLLEVPANVIITDVCLVVVDVMDKAVTATLDLADATAPVSLLAATALDAAALTAGTNLPVLVTVPTKLTATVAGTVAGLTEGTAKFVVSYIDYDRATMSYIGEQ